MTTDRADAGRTRRCASSSSTTINCSCPGCARSWATSSSSSASASEVDPAIELIRERDPDVVLVDVHMPGGRWRTRHPRCARDPSRHAVPRAQRLRLARRRDRDDPRRCARLRDEVDRARATSPTRSGGSSTATRCSRRASPASCSTCSPTVPVGAVDPELDQLTARAAGAPPDRAGTPTRRSPHELDDLGEDGRGARLRGAAQAAALEPSRAGPLGFGTSHRLSERPVRRRTNSR